MKAIKIFIALLFLISVVKVYAQSNSDDDTLVCLKVRGTIVADKKEGAYTVVLYKDSVAVDSLILHHWHKDFHFYLDRNAIYEIKISREGYQSKVICFDTSIPYDKDLMFDFHFHVKLLTNKILDLLDKDQAVNPIALVYYNARNNSFAYTRTNKPMAAGARVAGKPVLP